MADEAARRRELRRRRVLENAEERKRKIFGTTKVNDTEETAVCEDPPLPSLTRQPQSPKSFTPRADTTHSAQEVVHNVQENTHLLQDGINSVHLPPVTPSHSHFIVEDTTAIPSPFTSTARTERYSPTVLSPGSRLLNGSVPDSTEQLLHLGRLSMTNGNLSSAGGLQGAVQPELELSRSLLVPVLLALLVCCLLSFNLGYIVSNSIAFPFLLWESHNLWCRWQALHMGPRGTSGLLVFVLMLSGVSQATISTYSVMINVMKCFVEDFSVYIFTVVAWFIVVGLPNPVHGEALTRPGLGG